MSAAVDENRAPRTFAEWHAQFGHLLYTTDEAGKVAPSQYFLDYCKQEELAANNGLPLADEVLAFREQIWKWVLDDMLDATCPPARPERHRNPKAAMRRALFCDEFVEEGNGGRCPQRECRLREQTIALLKQKPTLTGAEKKKLRSLEAEECSHAKAKTLVRVHAQDQQAVLAALVALADYDTWVTGRHLEFHRGSTVHRKITVPKIAEKAKLPKRTVERVMKVFRGEAAPRENEITEAGASRREIKQASAARRIVKVLEQYHPRWGRAASVYIILLGPVVGCALSYLARRAAPKKLQNAGGSAPPVQAVAPPAPRRMLAVQAKIDEQKWSLIVDTISAVRGCRVAGEMNSDADRAAVIAVVDDAIELARKLKLANPERVAIEHLDDAYRENPGNGNALLDKGHPLAFLHKRRIRADKTVEIISELDALSRKVRGRLELDAQLAAEIAERKTARAPTTPDERELARASRSHARSNPAYRNERPSAPLDVGMEAIALALGQKSKGRGDR